MKSDSLLRFLCILLPALPAYSLDVREFGASGNGVTKDTKAIQAAIDAASAKGGGVVSLPPGKYLVGTLTLKSFVTLDLHSGATLVASPDDKDFAAFEQLPFKPVDDQETTYFRRALLTGEGLRQVAVTGMGVIEWNRKARGGPKTIALKKCDTVAIRGITIRNAPNYAKPCAKWTKAVKLRS